MNANGPLLRDIHVPAAGWWPPGPGWWLVALVVLLLLAGLAWRWRHRATRSTLAIALRDVDAMASVYAVDRDPVRLTDTASRLLRRVAVRIQPEVASQAGDAWREFVLAHARDAETRRVLEQLIDMRFRDRPHPDVPALLAALREWCGDALRVRPPRAVRNRFRARPAA